MSQFRIGYLISRAVILCAVEPNRHTNRHTTLLGICDLLETASIKGLAQVVEIPLWRDLLKQYVPLNGIVGNPEPDIRHEMPVQNCLALHAIAWHEALP